MHEAKRATQEAPDRRLRAIWRWPGIRAEAKRAWECIYRDAGQPRGGEPGEALAYLSITPSRLGADQGTTDGGPRYLATLAAAGLIQVLDRDKKRGVWTIYLLDPLDVARARRARGGDSATQFSFIDDPDEDVATEPAAAHQEYPPADRARWCVSVADLPADPRRRTDAPLQQAAETSDRPIFLRPAVAGTQIRDQTVADKQIRDAEDRKTAQAQAQRTDQYTDRDKTNKTDLSCTLQEENSRRGSAGRTATAGLTTIGEAAGQVVAGWTASDGGARALVLSTIRDAAWLADQIGRLVDLKFLPLKELARMLDQHATVRPASPAGYLRRQVESKLHELGVSLTEAERAEFKISLEPRRKPK
jgi:hypothetical protein